MRQSRIWCIYMVINPYSCEWTIDHSINLYIYHIEQQLLVMRLHHLQASLYDNIQSKGLPIERQCLFNTVKWSIRQAISHAVCYIQTPLKIVNSHINFMPKFHNEHFNNRTDVHRHKYVLALTCLCPDKYTLVLLNFKQEFIDSTLALPFSCG